LLPELDPRFPCPSWTCFGDSGGPHFLEETLVTVSVTSWGDAICRVNDMTQRTEIASVLDSSRSSE
jgi:secreted trypsin-like serine protease